MEQLSTGEMTLRVTTLYATLERLEQSGLVRVVAEEVVEGRARRTYDITEHGRQVLAQEAEQLLVRAQAARRGLDGATRRPVSGAAWSPASGPALA